MGKRRQIAGRVLAERWGISGQAVSKLLRRHDAPDFGSVEEADAWREAVRQRGVIHDGKISGSPTTSWDWKPEIDAADLLVAAKGDFHGSVIEHAREVVVRAYAALRDSTMRGEDAKTLVRLKVWGEAAKAAAGIERQFLEVQEQERQLIRLDEVLALWGNEMGAVRASLTGLGDACAAGANPDNPSLAKAVIDAAVDAVFGQMASAHHQIEAELRVGQAQDAEVAE